MTIWDWIRDYEMQALGDGDADGVRLCLLHGEAYSHRQTAPGRMMELLEQGRQLAQRRREPWWVAFFDHWQIETLIYYEDDYREVIGRAVRLALESRKPAYEGYPLRFGIWCNLVAAYLCVDARGYAASIREALAYLATIVPEEGGEGYLLQARRHWFAYELADYGEAERLALEELAMCDADGDRHTAAHHEADTRKALCWISYRQGEWEKLAEHAATGEGLARELGYRYELALFLMWRAACARRAGDETGARRHRRQAVGTMERLGQPPGESYFDALACYHEQAGETDDAWSVREEELACSQGKGHLAYEATIRLKRVALLKKRGRPLEDETAAARGAIARLRDPSWHLGQLEGLA